ncbi:transcription factor bHLH160 isoform X3 [Cannabis sativa]|uniref:transcription factor bHLH160 isoform X3 n=1 Tax=Cannabis sativa TaxID=3483 RepID=UPI0011DFB3FD|nr:transcription factor bHLH160 isoform X3 [Cannabis sativa]
MGDNNIVISSPSILEVLDDLWLVENQIIVNPSTYDDEQGISPLLRIENINGVSKHGYSHQNHHDSLILQASSENGNVFDVAHDQQDLIISSKVLKGRKSSKCNKKNLKSSTIIEDKRQTLIQSEVEEEEEKDTLIKKQEHNAKERIRRMKISETYMALGSLLPSTRLSKLKKRWTAPRIIDKALEYIPELENEIEELITLKKKTLSAVENIPVVEVVNQKNISSATLASPVNNSLTVSVNEVKKDEVIIQICRPRNKQKDFPSLLEYIEDQEQGIFIILSASTLHVCDERDCYHIHIQIMNESSTSSSNNGNDDSSAMLKEKVISWLTAN